MHDSPTPGVLARLGSRQADRLTLDEDVGPRVDTWAVEAATGARYRRGEVLVRFADGTDSVLRSQSLRSIGGARLIQTLPANWELLAVSDGMDATRAAGVLASDPSVAEVSLNYEIAKLQVRPNDEYYRLQWNFDAIGMPSAWQINPGGRNDVVVAVVDSGTNTVSDTVTFTTPLGQVPLRFSAAPDLPGDTRIVRPFDFVFRDDEPFDLEGHGTHVAGTVAQSTNNNVGVAGIAYNVSLMPVKVLGSDWDFVLNPTNRGGTVAVVAEGIRYAADNGAKVINLSLGGLGPAPTIRDAIVYAVDHGAFVAIAAGNEAEEGNPTEYPAAYARDIVGAMAVGAVNRSLHRAAYSNFQPYVEICAPGGEMEDPGDYEHGITQVSYDDNFTLTYLTPLQMFTALRLGIRPTFDRFVMLPLQGTSMATPHVSGVAALLYAQGIRDPRAIEQAIVRFARKIDARADECGAGLVDPRRALRGLGLGR